MTSTNYLIGLNEPDTLVSDFDEETWLNSPEFDLALIDLGVEKERLQVESDLESRFYFERHAKDYDLDDYDGYDF